MRTTTIAFTVCFAIMLVSLPCLAGGRYFYIPRHVTKPCTAASPLPNAPFSARVIRIHDGDTISISNGSRHMRVRFYGVDSPEYHQAHGKASARNLDRMIKGRTLRFVPKNRDKYNRIVAVPYLPNGACLLEAVVENGDAWVFDDFCLENALCSRLRAAQERARAARRGLWNYPGAIPPSIWRSVH